MNRIKALLKSKAVWGAVGAAVTYLTGLDHPISLHDIIQVATPVISVIGLRDAQTKHGI